MNLQQLEQEERELMKRLAEIRKMKMKLKPIKKKSNETDVTSFMKMANAIVESRNGRKDYTKDQLEKLTKKELIAKLGFNPRSNSTKTDIINTILNNQRAIKRGEAFLKLEAPN